MSRGGGREQQDGPGLLGYREDLSEKVISRRMPGDIPQKEPLWALIGEFSD